MTTRDFSSPSNIVVCGGVERGDRRGRQLGFPTANLAVENISVIDGVWAGWVHRASKFYAAAISIGTRPTFYGRDGFRLLEAHILNFDQDIYDEVISVRLVQRLRDIRQFDSIEALVRQLDEDVAVTRAWSVDAARPDNDGGLIAFSAPLGRAVLLR